MKKILFTILMSVLPILMFSQIPMRYTVKLISQSGIEYTVDIDNYNKKPNIPPPILVDKCIRDGQEQHGCVYYDGEYSWTDVKSIDIIKVTYFESVQKKNNKQSKFIITHRYYWDYRLGRYVRLNIIRQR